LSVEAVQERVICEEDTALALRLVGTLGEVVSLLIVRVTLLDVAVFPAASRATAVRVWVPFAAVAVFQERV
jgi:hypothetical protein